MSQIWDERAAKSYDAASTDMFDPAVLVPTVDFLADLAGDGAALELAIGTGRVAVPLSQRGVPVSGIDLSAPMVEQLQAKPGAEAIDVTIGDIATTKVDRTFRLVYLVYNTISNLLTQDRQVECFLNVASHLEPGGHFVIELGIPELQRLPPGDTARAFTVTRQHLGFDTYDVAAQTLVSHHYWLVGDRMETFESQHRYLWPAELDLMARIAGLTLAQRWENWDRTPFTGESHKHISVWQKPAS